MPASSLPLLRSSSSPLLPSSDAHTCHLRDARQRALQSAFSNCARTPGFTPPVPRNSPVLLEFFKRCLGDRATASGIASLPPRTRRVVYAIYAVAVLTMAIMTAVTPTLLLNLRHLGLAGRDNLQFYVTLTVIGMSVPVFTHVLLAQAADYFGAPLALAGAACCVAAGLFGMGNVGGQRLPFAIAYLVFSIAQSIRPVRTIVLADVSTDETRTEVMSYHALCTPIGALFGPLAWLGFAGYEGDWMFLGWVRVNRFSLDYYFAAVLSLCIAGVTMFLLPRQTKGWGRSQEPDDDGGADEKSELQAEPEYDEQGEVMHLTLSDVRSTVLVVRRLISVKTQNKKLPLLLYTG